MSLRIVTPSRLHFGLLAWGDEVPRQFGSVGLMIDRPGVSIEAIPADRWSAEGPLASRAIAVAQKVTETLFREGKLCKPLQFQIDHAPAEHIGLGTGTQLSLAITRLILSCVGERCPAASRLAALSGRGLRSGVGLHGFLHGGLILDGGRSPQTVTPPLIARLNFPADWEILVVTPPTGIGLAGSDEHAAFARLPGMKPHLVDRLCGLVLLELLPSVAERKLNEFGAALVEMQRIVGQTFAPAQGGPFANSQVESIADEMTRLGLQGVGQSSWGPTLYGFLERDSQRQSTIISKIIRIYQLNMQHITWTIASQSGAEDS